MGGVETVGWVEESEGGLKKVYFLCLEAATQVVIIGDHWSFSGKSREARAPKTLVCLPEPF